MLATILTVPRHLRAQPTWYEHTRGEQLLGRKAVLVLFWLTGLFQPTPNRSGWSTGWNRYLHTAY
jgi:hypothetical protein